MDQKVGGVVGIGVHIFVCAGIAAGRVVQQVRDREICREPIAVAQQRPIEERPRGATVAIDEWMVVADHEMAHDGSDHSTDYVAILANTCF